MKYYLRAKNTETGQSMILSTPVFTDKNKAKQWADDFVKSFGTPVAEMTVVREDEINRREMII